MQYFRYFSLRLCSHAFRLRYILTYTAAVTRRHHHVGFRGYQSEYQPAPRKTTLTNTKLAFESGQPWTSSYPDVKLHSLVALVSIVIGE